MSDFNLPPGVTSGDIDRHFGEKPTCMECCHLMELCYDCGVCNLDYYRAYDDGEFDAPTIWETLAKARDWIADHIVDGQEAACERYAG